MSRGSREGAKVAKVGNATRARARAREETAAKRSDCSDRARACAGGALSALSASQRNRLRFIPQVRAQTRRCRTAKNVVLPDGSLRPIADISVRGITVAMDVLVEFNPAYDGHASDAVWIIASPHNRSWFERHVGSIDPNSAVFDEDVTPIGVIWHVFDHHPDWTEIVVRGAALTSEIEEGIGAGAVVASSEGDGFRLRRP